MNTVDMKQIDSPGYWLVKDSIYVQSLKLCDFLGQPFFEWAVYVNGEYISIMNSACSISKHIPRNIPFFNACGFC